MDTMKLLLGATIALLLGALAVSWQGMNQGVKNTPPDEIARLQKQVKELRAEQDNLKMQRDLQLLRSESVQTPANSELEAMKLQLAQNKRALEEMELRKEAEARDKKVAQDEEGLLAQRGLEGKDSELRRARMISDALLVGRIKEYVEDAQYGGFVTFEVLMPEQIQTGVIVAIRRKTGILGQLKVSDITPEGAIANPLPGFGPVKPQVGDELILPPQY
jgi:TolA-binding protein